MGQRAANSNRAPQASADGANSTAERAVWIASNIAVAAKRGNTEVANGDTTSTEESPTNYSNIFNTERGTRFIKPVECNRCIDRGSDWPAVAAAQAVFVSLGQHELYLQQPEPPQRVERGAGRVSAQCWRENGFGLFDSHLLHREASEPRHTPQTKHENVQYPSFVFGLVCDAPGNAIANQGSASD